MNISLLVRGLIVGLAIAAPVGPISILCINRALVDGFLSGFVSALGAATADAVFAYMGVFGLTFITSVLVSQQVWLRLIGGIFLCYLGLKTFLERPAVGVSGMEALLVVSAKGNNLIEDFASIFFLTLTNPMTILPFAAIFAGLQAENVSLNTISGGVFVLGVFISTALWGSLLSGVFSLFRVRVNLYGLQWINRLSGVTIIGFGLVMVLHPFIHASRLLH